MTPATASANIISSAARLRSRPIAYWVATLVLGVEGIVGGMLALVRWAPYAGVIGHLG